MMHVTPSHLTWMDKRSHQEAILGDFDGGDGVRFTLERYPTCYRRGIWRLFIEVAPGRGHLKWGCFDGEDQPLRWYHVEPNAKAEAQALADVLYKDRTRRGPKGRRLDRARS